MKKIMSMIALTSLIASAAVYAEPVKSEKQAKRAVETRQAIFKLVGSNMGPLGAMARGDAPFNAQVMEKNAERMAQLGAMIEDYFVPDATSFDLQTEALDGIWKNKADFNQKAQDMLSAAKALQLVAASGKESEFRGAIGTLGGTCKACHDDYKKD